MRRDDRFSLYIQFVNVPYGAKIATNYFLITLSNLVQFLANLNSRSRSLYVVVRLSVVCLSVTFVRPTQAIRIFGNASMPFGAMASVDIQIKFCGDRPRGTPPSGS